MRNFKHLTPYYIYQRIALIVYEKLNPNQPWITKESIDLINRLLKKTDVGVEFGSGRSTKWFLDRMNNLLSVESNKDWYEQIKDECKSEIINGRLQYEFATSKEDYLSIINIIKDNSIDFCLVDGEYRDLCAFNMINKIKEGGLLVVDNINWLIPVRATKSPHMRTFDQGCESEIWQKFTEKVSGWRCIWTSNGVTDTAIWIKNSN